MSFIHIGIKVFKTNCFSKIKYIFAQFHIVLVNNRFSVDIVYKNLYPFCAPKNSQIFSCVLTIRSLSGMVSSKYRYSNRS